MTATRMDDLLLYLGIALIIVGVGLWSVPGACIAAGAACLLLSASLASSSRKGRE